jgi:uncharacterized membrane protein
MVKKENLKFNPIDCLIISIVLFLLIYTWCVVIIAYPNLPETIAIHFDGSGNPDDYSSKGGIWLAPSIFTILCIGFIFSAKYPEQLSFTKKKISEREKKAHSKKGLFASLLCSSLLILITHSIIKTSIDKKDNPMFWIIPTIFALITLFLASIFYYKYKYLK